MENNNCDFITNLNDSTLISPEQKKENADKSAPVGTEEFVGDSL